MSSYYVALSVFTQSCVLASTNDGPKSFKPAQLKARYPMDNQTRFCINLEYCASFNPRLASTSSPFFTTAKAPIAGKSLSSLSCPHRLRSPNSMPWNSAVTTASIAHLIGLSALSNINNAFGCCDASTPLGLITPTTMKRTTTKGETWFHSRLSLSPGRLLTQRNSQTHG